MRRDAAQASLNKNGDKTRCAQTAVEIEMISEPTFCPSNCVGTAHGAGTQKQSKTEIAGCKP